MFEADWHVGIASIYGQKIKHLAEANKTSASAGFKTDAAKGRRASGNRRNNIRNIDAQTEARGSALSRTMEGVSSFALALSALTPCGLIRFGWLLGLASPSGFQNAVIHSQHRLLGCLPCFLTKLLRLFREGLSLPRNKFTL